MTLEELVAKIHAADRKHGGCSVEITTINTPADSKGSIYGIVNLGGGKGGRPFRRVFRDEKDLVRMLEE